MKLTPGVPLLAKTIVGLCVPSVVLIALSRSANKHFAITVPAWLLWATCLASVPFLVVCAIWYTILHERYGTWKLGAQPLPRLRGKWIGDIDLLLEIFRTYKKGYFYDTLWDGSDAIGPSYDTFALWEHDIITCDPDVIKTILATDFDNYVKGPVFQYANKTVLGSGVFNVDGDLWKFHRGMSRPFFNRDRIAHFGVFDKHADTALTKLKTRLNEGHAVDFQDLIGRFTLDVATEFLFGSCVCSLASDLPFPFNAPQSTQNALPNRAEEFARAFKTAQSVLSERLLLQGIWPFTEILTDRVEQPMKVVRDLLDPVFKEALSKEQMRQSIGEKAEEDDTLLGHLAKETSDLNIIRDEILNIMLAGRDTTAAALTFCMYFLCTHPGPRKRLREEILQRLGPNAAPTPEDIRELKYLRAFINESLRLFPPVPWNSRATVKETTWANPDPSGKPYYIPAQANVSFSVFMMHRRKDFWGPDAEVFDPDRFIDERLHKYLVPNPFIFMPFNGGPRICLGQQFAYNEISYFLVRLLQNFESMELDAAAQPPEARVPPEWQSSSKLRVRLEKIRPKHHLTIYVEGGLWVRLRKAEDKEGEVPV
ncbi:hypothetical protein EIP91_003526 [Steccherinum ochraceum]|uniref:Cytochrome P450-dit2 n=1 Tax=Steccherinum ochraceum TaxID=92696 RepID=A0A4R0RUY5_9APHY|nr:hypothetical protein EIP91_003526 [Steccherinum ochraceum]